MDRNVDVVAFVDHIAHGSDEQIMSIPVMGDHSSLPRLIKNGVNGVIITIGDDKVRTARFKELRDKNLELVNAHPTSYIAPSAKLGSGVTSPSKP